MTNQCDGPEHDHVGAIVAELEKMSPAQQSIIELPIANVVDDTAVVAAKDADTAHLMMSMAVRMSYNRWWAAISSLNGSEQAGVEMAGATAQLTRAVVAYAYVVATKAGERSVGD